MAQVKRKSEWQIGEQPAMVAAEGALSSTAHSPARALQQMLEERTGVQIETQRWSRRRSTALIVAASCALWAALLTMAHTVSALAA